MSVAELAEPDDYRLRASEALADEVRRVARARAEHALVALRDELSDDPVEAVHTARKDMKKMRSLLRLLREALGDDVYDRENDALREAANVLSGVRDADVMLETIAALETRFPNLTAATGPLRAAVGADRRDDVSPRADEAANIIAEVASRIGEWPLNDLDAAVDDGLLRAYRRGRDRFSEAADDPSAEAMHEWRKRGKDLWYHLRLLAGAWPELLESLAEEVHTLTDHLGDHHDLAVLAERARAELAEGEPLATLLDATRRRQAEHEAEAFALGRRVYAEKPKAFSKRMRALRRAPQPYSY